MTDWDLPLIDEALEDEGLLHIDEKNLLIFQYAIPNTYYIHEFFYHSMKVYVFLKIEKENTIFSWSLISTDIYIKMSYKLTV